MDTKRLEAFSDAVMAIIMTILVLDLKVPATSDLAALWSMWPVFASFALTFLNIGINWNIHHHVMTRVARVDDSIVWANLFLLFCLALFPFATAWMGEQEFARWPTALYGLIFLANALSWMLVEHRIIVADGADGNYARMAHSDLRRKLTQWVYLASVIVSVVGYPRPAFGMISVVVLWWLAPDHLLQWRLRGSSRS